MLLCIRTKVTLSSRFSLLVSSRCLPRTSWSIWESSINCLLVLCVCMYQDSVGLCFDFSNILILCFQVCGESVLLHRKWISTKCLWAETLTVWSSDMTGLCTTTMKRRTGCLQTTSHRRETLWWVYSSFLLFYFFDILPFFFGSSYFLQTNCTFLFHSEPLLLSPFLSSSLSFCLLNSMYPKCNAVFLIVP